ncbi:hypothetical protein DSECCO2_543790 [anaerobic digester metagenome]
MTLDEIFSDKSFKPKAKTELLSRMLLEKTIGIEELIAFAGKAKDPVRATCMEALEFATKEKPEMANAECLHFAVSSLASKAPRVKWESARVIGNIAHRFPDQLDTAIVGLLANSEDSGTVVRWSAAFALGEIIKLKTKHNKDLIPAAEAIVMREEKNSIRKIYMAALKKVAK